MKALSKHRCLKNEISVWALQDMKVSFCPIDYDNRKLNFWMKTFVYFISSAIIK
jgi:hypothetical protein